MLQLIENPRMELLKNSNKILKFNGELLVGRKK